MKKIKVTIRKENGTYWANTENIQGIVVADGQTLQEVKNNLQEAFEFHLEQCKKDNDTEFVERYANGVIFAYEIALNGISKQLAELNLAEVARRLHISPTMMRKYATGKANPSEKRLLEIQQGIREIGKELQEINLF